MKILLMKKLKKKGRDSMKVGIFTDTYPPEINGVATSCEMLKKTLESHGHEVFLVTTNSSLN